MDDESIKKGLWDDHRNISLTEAENIIKSNLNGCARNFVAIGFYLKDIRDNETYRKGGYESIWDFAQDKLQMAKSTVSRFMAINDRFSVNGNTPVLMDKYLDYGSGKLQEMLTMTDEEIANINPETTVKEIREIKKNRCDAQLEPEKPLPLSTVGKPKKVYPEGSALSTPGCEGGYSCFSCGRDCQIRQEGRYCVDVPLGNPFTCSTMNVHENLKADIGDKCMFVNLDLARIRSGDKEPVPCCKECTEKCGYECNRSAHVVNKKSSTSPYDDKKPDIGVTIYNVGGNGKVEKLEVVSKYSSFSEKYFDVKDKSGNIHYLSAESEHWHYSREDAKKDSWYREKTSVTSEIVNSNPESEVVEAEVIQGDGIVLDCYNDEEGWHKEIIQSSLEDELDDEPEDEELGNMAELLIAKELLIKKQSDLKAWTEATKDNRNSSDVRNINKLKIEIGAMAAYICDLDNIVDPIPKPEQPELPVLKNNDQRKDWAENYKAWGEWYHDENIDCHYYKYDFQNGDRLIVEEYQDREAYWGNDKRNYNYFHLLQKEKLKYEKNKTYEKKYEHDTSSMTEIVDYLKDIQKKGAQV